MDALDSAIRKATVVVADDDYGNRLALEGVLEPVAEVVAFDSGEAALKFLLDHPACAAVILDLHMGALGGFEVARLLRARRRTREVPIVFLTGKRRDAALEGYAEGAFDFITKPFDPDVLRAKVAALVHLYALRRDLEHDRDVSMQREHSARAETAAQRKYLYDFLGQAPGLIARFYGPTHVFEFVNDAYVEANGNKDPTGKTILETVSRLSGPQMVSILDEVYRSGVAADTIEVPVTVESKGESRQLYFNVSHQPIRGFEGNIEGVFLHGTDVTNQVNSRNVAEALSERASRLAALQEQIMAIVGHDLRNPLQAISMTAQLLSKDKTGTAAASGVRILRSAKRMNQIINDIFEYTQAHLNGGIQIKEEPCNLGDLCGHVVDEFVAVHPNRVIDLDVPRDIVGQWDSSRLQQMLSNLVANGLQYSAPDSKILVQVEEELGDALLRVKNRGIPIAEEKMKELFEPFKRGNAESTRGNMGLGLFIVDQIVRAHGGTIKVSSSEAEGTTFTVRLPKARPDVAPGSATRDHRRSQ